jgi:hypothetical protein
MAGRAGRNADLQGNLFTMFQPSDFNLYETLIDAGMIVSAVVQVVSAILEVERTPTSRAPKVLCLQSLGPHEGVLVGFAKVLLPSGAFHARLSRRVQEA